MATGLSVHEELVDNLEVSEPLLDNLNHEPLQSPCDGNEYYTITKSKRLTQTERESEKQAREEETFFLNTFPTQRKKIKRNIRVLCKMADAIDEIHKKSTKVNIATNSISATSGALTILGMTLAPFTAGGSLILASGGLGLGIMAIVGGVSASMYESSRTSKETKKAQKLIEECREILQLPEDDEALEESGTSLFTNASPIFKIFSAGKEIKTNVQALKVAKANPGLKALAKRFSSGGSTSQVTIRGAKQVKKAFGGTSLAMTKGLRLLGAATAAVSLLHDAYSIVQDVQHLQDGTKAEIATEIRKKARNLKAILKKLDKHYKELKDKQSIKETRKHTL